MKILVPVKRVPDYETKIKLHAERPEIVTDGIKWVINPFDEIAVEEALRIKERFQQSAGGEVEVVVVSIGSSSVVEQVRMALAMGADRGIVVLHENTEETVDSLMSSAVLAKVFEKEQPTLVIMGKQAVDSDANQTGQLLAAKLDLPQATFASKIEFTENNQRILVTREVDGGLETIDLALPAVVTTDLRLNEPRYPSLPGIVKAKKKPVEEIAVSALGIVNFTPGVKIHRLAYPAKRQAGVKLSSVAELVEKLKNEAKVL